MLQFPEIHIPDHGSFCPLDARASISGTTTAWLIYQYGKDAFRRNNMRGHITSSGFIVSQDRTQTLLMHHRKLDRWLQPGGHCDDEFNALSVATREVAEETGLTSFALAQTSIFDIDVHEFPARDDAPAHFHFDIRYLFEADPEQPTPGNSESLALSWIKMEDLERYTNDPSVLVVRQAAKGHRE